MLKFELRRFRRIDRGNASPSTIGADFNRLGLSFWQEVQLDDARNFERQQRLERLTEWRNAIAHQDFDSAELVPSSLTLRTVRVWRRGCDALAKSFDRVMSRYLATILGSPPW